VDLIISATVTGLAVRRSTHVSLRSSGMRPDVVRMPPVGWAVSRAQRKWRG